jgi:hypothetical protein
MALKFQRWDIVGDDGRVTAVLRLCEDGELLSDPGHVDCFAQTAPAAEAAWLRVGGPPPRGTWLQEADRAMATWPVDAVRPADGPRPRILQMDLVAHGGVKWLADLAGQSLAASRTFDAPDSPQASSDSLDAFLTDDNAPLSGQMNEEWALAEVAGLNVPDVSPSADALGTVSDGPLSGVKTRDWKLVDFAADAAGSKKKDPEEP